MTRALMLVAVLCACGSTKPTTTDSSAPAARTCDVIQTEARNALGAAIADNQTCAVDADCTTVAYAAGCFDSCTRAIAATGENAYTAALAAVDSAQCHEYSQKGCPSPEIPPCAPPAAPTCVAGVCQ